MCESLFKWPEKNDPCPATPPPERAETANRAGVLYTLVQRYNIDPSEMMASLIPSLLHNIIN